MVEDKKIKLIYIIDSLGTGGAEKVLTMLANYIALKEKYDVTVITLSDDKPFFITNDFVDLVQLGIVKQSIGFIGSLKNIINIIKVLKKEIREQDPDMVISFMTETNVLTTIASKLVNKPIIISEHSAFFRGQKNRFWKLLRRMIYPLSDALIVLTDEDIPKYDFVKRKYKIVNPLILKQKHDNIERENIILGVGRLHPVKGFDLLIEAFSKLKIEKWRLMIAGEGDEREKLEKLIKNNDLSEKVTLLGSVSDIEYYYKKSSIFVLSSHSEGFPGALCEAMGYGCACVAFDCPTGPKEIITDNEDGILVEAENVEALSMHIQNLIDDPDRRNKLGEKALNISEKLSIETITSQWIYIILNNIDKKDNHE